MSSSTFFSTLCNVVLAAILAQAVVLPVSAERTVQPGGQTSLEPVVLAAGPAISNVAQSPSQPGDLDAIRVTAKVVAGPSAISSVDLHYRVMYGSETVLPMFDDGAHGDGSGGDGVYGASIPADASLPGQMVRYFILAKDLANTISRLPTFLSPTKTPEYFGTMIADPGVVSALPVFYWFVADPVAADTRDGTRASVYYNGTFYDNVSVGIRGTSSLTWPKHNFKFGFNEGYYFNLSPDYAPFKEFRLNSTYSDKSFMRTVLAWETYRDAGVPYSLGFPIRIQQNNAFYSVASFVEIVAEKYLQRQKLDPNGALYKMDNELISSTVGVEKVTRTSEDNSDLQALVDALALSVDARTKYLFDNVNLPEVINYMAASVIMHDNDLVSKNFYMYRDTLGTKEWSVLPWDKDLVFGRNFNPEEYVLNDTIWADDDPYSHPLFGGSAHPKVDGYWNRLYEAIFSDLVLREMYLRRLRTLMDTLLQSPGNSDETSLHFETRINAMFAQLQPDVALDKAKWPNDWGSPQGFLQAVNILKQEYLAVRRVHLFETHGPANGGIIPAEQSAEIGVRFGPMEANPASGLRDDEYFTLLNPNVVAVDISGWKVSDSVTYTFPPGTVIPGNGRIVVAGNVVAFRAHNSGQGNLVLGGYVGRLAGSSTVLALSRANGAIVVPAFKYFVPAINR